TETSPLAVLRRIEEMVEARGGRTNGVEVIGMIPDELVFPAAVERLSLRDATMDRLLSRRLAAYLSRVEQSPVHGTNEVDHEAEGEGQAPRAGGALGGGHRGLSPGDPCGR